MLTSQAMFAVRRKCLINFHGIPSFSMIASFSSYSTTNFREVNKFNVDAKSWWDKTAHPVLHYMNALRVPFVRDGILSTRKTQMRDKISQPLKGFHILDVGCGGGILSEPLARLGASVTGLDPGPDNIDVATKHAAEDKCIKDRLNYVCETIEIFSQKSQQFDAVVCSEVIEHVENVPLFVQLCTELLKDGGSIFFTTPNRTTLSYLGAVILWEYVLGRLPKKTHDWNKFVSPEELCKMLESNNCTVISYQGMICNPVTYKFSWCQSNAVLYALHAVKDNSVA